MDTNAQNQTTAQTPATRQGDQRPRDFIEPPANITATENEYLLEMDMPGVEKNGLEITVEDNDLTIIGRRQPETTEGELLYCESPQADYRRSFELGPDVDPSKIRAEIRHGVLSLQLPKSEKAKPRHIEIQAG